MLSLSLARGALVAAAIAGVTFAVACSSSNGTSIATPFDAGKPPVVDAGGACTTSGGAMSGAGNARCSLADGGKVTQAVSSASCHAAARDAGDARDAGHASDANDEGDAAHDHADAGAESEYGETLYGTEGDDDDCKYHVKWSATDVCSGADATFSVTVAATETGAATSGAKVRVEVFLDETHPAPNTRVAVTESPNGTYKLGPVRFDKPGKWTVRFHFNDDCDDTLESSPHGHAAFYVNVP